MDNTEPQGSPGGDRERCLKGPNLGGSESCDNLDVWTSSTTVLDEVQKDPPSASRLFFLAVEFVGDQANDYGEAPFTGFEKESTFSPNQSSSLCDFDQRVSPVDPSMGSVTQFSQRGVLSRTSLPRDAPIAGNAISSTPSSPFPSQVLVLTNPPSPLVGTTPSNILPSSPTLLDTSHGHSPLSNSIVTTSEISRNFANHILSSTVQSPVTCTSTDSSEELLTQVVPADTFFDHHTSPKTGSVLQEANKLLNAPLNPNSPHSPIRSPLSPADNYVVSSSTESLEQGGTGLPSFQSKTCVSVASSPGIVDSTSELIINSSVTQQGNEIAGTADSSRFRCLEAAGVVMSTTSDGHLKPDVLDRVQLLISASDGSIRYNLGGDPCFLGNRVVDMEAGFLTSQTIEEQHLNSVFNSLKAQGLVIESEIEDLQIHAREAEERAAEAKLAGALGLRDLTLAVRQTHSDLLEQTLLGTQLNGDLAESVERLGQSLLSDDVKISIVDPSLDTVGAYTDILMDGCVEDDIGGEVISGDPLGHDPTDFCQNFSTSSLDGSKCKLPSLTESILSRQDLEKLTSEQSLVSVCTESSNSMHDSDVSQQFQDLSEKLPLSEVWSTLPAFLTIAKVPEGDGEAVEYGVFTRKSIPKGTQFGPIKGVSEKAGEVNSDPEMLKKALVLLVEDENGEMQKLDISECKTSSWMQFVRAATTFKEQNLLLNQQGKSLFFTTTKVIHVHHELRFWYSLPYAKKHGLPLLHPDSTENKCPGGFSSAWVCFECSEKFASSLELQMHLNIHIIDKGYGAKLGLSKERLCRKLFRRGMGLRFAKDARIFSGKCNRNTSQQCQRCCRAFPRVYSLKRRAILYSKAKKYLCEVCSFQFSHMFNRDQHMQRHKKETTVTAGLTKLVPVFEQRKLMLKASGHSQKNGKTEWFCVHCNLTFDNPSVLNLHTLAHAAENLEETEVITGLPSDIISSDCEANKSVRCPKCTKKIDPSDVTHFSESQYSEGEVNVTQDTKSNVSTQDSLQINSNDGNLTYSLDGDTSFMGTRVVDMEAGFLTSQTIDEQHLNSVINSLKAQGLVIEEGEIRDLQIHTQEAAEAGALGLRDLTLAVRQTHSDLIEQTLLGTQLNRDLAESVERLGQSLLSDDVKISIVDPSLDTVGAYTDILMDGCVEDDIGGEVISGDPLGHDPTDFCQNFSTSSLDGSKCKLPSLTESILSRQDLEKLTSEQSLVSVCTESSNSMHDSDVSQQFQDLSEKLPLSEVWSTLPAFLTIAKVPESDGEDVEYGVFTRKSIPKGTQFGPIKGVSEKAGEVNSDPEMLKKALVLLVEDENGEMQKLDISKCKTSSWMQFVRVAKTFKEQNLLLNQQGKSLFFTAAREIPPLQELCVWYSVADAAKRNLPVLEPNIVDEKSADNIWPCFECDKKFSSSESLQIHLNVHVVEREDEDSQDKHQVRRMCRGFRRRAVLPFCGLKYRGCSDKHSEGFAFQCRTCNRAFPRHNNFKRHQLLRTKDTKFICEVCGCHFPHMYSRDRHIRRRHKDLAMSGNLKNAYFKKKFALKSNSQFSGPGHMEWFCPHCGLCFENLLVLNLHTLTHGGEFMLEGEEFQCPQCSKEFVSKRELIEHSVDHAKLSSPRRLRGTLNPAKPWKCELCYKSFAAQDRLQRHMLVHGAEESKPLQCDVCYKRFLNNSALACHVKIHTEKKMFECPICKVVFDQVLSLKEHVLDHSENGLYTCPQCNKVFDGYSLIRKHIRAFHSDRKHTCNYCGKLFPKLDKLRMHMLRHSDHREFLCANCGKQFKRKDKLKEHMKRMHSAERELRLAMKPHRPPTVKKFMPKVQVSPTDYHRFIYKCHTCLLGFKRRGMLVNHLAKRHPDISPESVPELNLPILKTTRDYYCQYCEKVYKSSSKRKAHILKIHPGAELPMSNRRKGGVPEIPGLPNPTFSQTVGSITTHPHGCPWCHKQYASKAKLLQHQRKKHIDLLPQSQQIPRVVRTPPSQHEEKTVEDLPPQLAVVKQQELTSAELDEPQLQNVESVISIIPGDYQITTDEELGDFPESGIIIDTSSVKRPMKVLPDGIPADLLSQAMAELTDEFTVSVDTASNDQYLHIVQTSPGHITITQSPQSPSSSDNIPSTTAILNDADTLSPTSISASVSTNLHHLLSESYSLPSSPTPTPSPQTWSNVHGTFTPYTAR